MTLTELRALYTAHDPGAKYAAYTDGEQIGFGAARVLESRAQMYRATGDASFLAEGAKEIDLILATAAANKDTHKPGWGFTSNMYPLATNAKYGHLAGTVWMPYTAHAGGACTAIADWCMAARACPEWKAKADATVALLVTHFASQWDAEFRSARGGSCIILSPFNLYYDGIAPGWSMPPNQTNMWGRFLLKLWHLTGNAVYRDKAVALATCMKSTMWMFATGWCWPYAAKLLNGDLLTRYQGLKIGNPPPKGYEYLQTYVTDSSHANFDLYFIADMAAANLVFTQDDLAKIARTFIDHVYAGPSKKSYHWMNGSGANDNTNYAGFARLAKVSPQMGDLIWQLLNTTAPSNTTLILAVSHLAAAGVAV